MAAGEVDHPAVARGVAYLAETQDEDGAVGRGALSRRPASRASSTCATTAIRSSSRSGRWRATATSAQQQPARRVRDVSVGAGWQSLEALPLLMVTGLLQRSRASLAGRGHRPSSAGPATPSGLRAPARRAVDHGKRPRHRLRFGIAGGLDRLRCSAGDLRGRERDQSPSGCALADRAGAVQGAGRRTAIGRRAIVGGRSPAPSDDRSRRRATRSRCTARPARSAVDMESHVAARVAARHGLPFAALRVISDPASRSLPAWR